VSKKKIILGTIVALVLIGGAVGVYKWNEPHRDVQQTEADFRLSATEFVTEYLDDPSASNTKYLATDGNSLILIIEGKVASLDETISGNRIVILESDHPDLGIKCTFLPTEGETVTIEEGSVVEIKGVVRSGPSYDKDLDLYEHASLGDCALVES